MAQAYENSQMSVILGRPRLINMKDCTIKPPLDTDIPSDPSQTVPREPGPNQKPSTYSHRLFGYAIGRMIHEMLDQGADKQFVKDYEVVRELHRQLDTQLDGLPPAIRPRNPDTSWDFLGFVPREREQISILANSFLMSLHRDHAEVNIESRQAAIFAALSSLEAQDRIFPLIHRHHYRIYGLSCHSIDSCIFLTSLLLKNLITDALLLQRALNALVKAIARLNTMRDRSLLAGSGASILSNCYQTLTRNVTSTAPQAEGPSSAFQPPRQLQDQLDLSAFDSGTTSASVAAPDLAHLQPDSLGDRFQPAVFEQVMLPPLSSEPADEELFGDLNEFDMTALFEGSGLLGEKVGLDFPDDVEQ